MAGHLKINAIRRNSASGGGGNILRQQRLRPTAGELASTTRADDARIQADEPSHANYIHHSSRLRAKTRSIRVSSDNPDLAIPRGTDAIGNATIQQRANQRGPCEIKIRSTWHAS